MRFPNPIIPFSYYTASLIWHYPVIQVYFKSEEFQPEFDSALAGFNLTYFGEKEVHALLKGLIYDLNVNFIYHKLLKKSLDVLEFMAKSKNANCYTKYDWQRIYKEYSGNIIYSYNFLLYYS